MVRSRWWESSACPKLARVVLWQLAHVGPASRTLASCASSCPIRLPAVADGSCGTPTSRRRAKSPAKARLLAAPHLCHSRGRSRAAIGPASAVHAERGTCRLQGETSELTPRRAASNPGSGTSERPSIPGVSSLLRGVRHSPDRIVRREEGVEPLAGLLLAAGNEVPVAARV